MSKHAMNFRLVLTAVEKSPRWSASQSGTASARRASSGAWCGGRRSKQPFGLTMRRKALRR